MENKIIKPKELLFMEKYGEAKKEIRKRKEFVDFVEGRTYNKIFESHMPSLKYLREIEIIQEALSKVCGNYAV